MSGGGEAKSPHPARDARHPLPLRGRGFREDLLLTLARNAGEGGAHRAPGEGSPPRHELGFFALLTIVLLTIVLISLPAIAEPACVVVPGWDHLNCYALPKPPEANYGIHRLDEVARTKMRGVSWQPKCPVPLDALSVVTVPYLDEHGDAHPGDIVVATRVAPAVERIFHKLYESAFPIAQMRPIEAFGAEDARSMAENNTTGFNCRSDADPNEWSRHAYGDAVDVNPLWNPFVKGTIIRPPAGVKWLNRAKLRPGMTVRGGTAAKIFRAEGWRWGGRWPKPQDYQHFSPAGR